jgi:hypothetical protein
MLGDAVLASPVLASPVLASPVLASPVLARPVISIGARPPATASSASRDLIPLNAIAASPRV